MGLFTCKTYLLSGEERIRTFRSMKHIIEPMPITGKAIKLNISCRRNSIENFF